MHYRTLVIIPAERATEAHAAVTELMEPFDENAHQDDPQTEECCEDPACEDCHGTRTLTYHRNARGKWDWWVIGGRYCGHLSGDDNQPDPTDDCCYPSIEHRGCKYPDQHINVFPLIHLRNGWSVYNIVTPDGDWHEKETYVPDNPQGERFVQRPDWDQFRFELASGYADHYGVCVDIHR